jgi:tripartite-type tricarboxylate transporter receptor subunit TctC
LAVLANAGVALGQSYPARPVRLVVGFAAGGVADLLGRALARKMTELWQEQVVVDNRAGAGGVLAMQITAKAAPDGYTLMLIGNGPMVMTPALRTDLPYNPIRDYRAITSAASAPIVISVQPTFAAHSLRDLIQMAKAAPAGQRLIYASTGVGAMPHISAELFQRVAGIELTHVPYRGGGESLAALLGGHVQMSFGAASTSLAHIRAGRLQALAVTSLKRLPAIPDVPTFSEAAVPGFEAVQWFGIFAPAGIPASMVNKINTDVRAILASAEIKDHFTAQAIEILGSSPKDFSTYVRGELPKWTRLLKEMGIKDIQ